MLSPSEKEQFKNLNALDSKTRANFLFRVSKKIEKTLSELNEINEVLCAMPEKNAKRLLNDDIINSIFTLSENMVQKMGYVPIKKDLFGREFVMRKGPGSLSKDGKSKTFEVKIEPATGDDSARQRLVNDHIEVLQYIMGPDAGFPIWELPDSVMRHVYSDSLPVMNKLERWGRPRVRNMNADEGHLLPK